MRYVAQIGWTTDMNKLKNKLIFFWAINIHFGVAYATGIGPATYKEDRVVLVLILLVIFGIAILGGFVYLVKHFSKRK